MKPATNFSYDEETEEFMNVIADETAAHIEQIFKSMYVETQTTEIEKK